MTKFKQIMKNTKSQIQDKLQNADTLKYDFQYNPSLYSIAYTGVLTIGFLTGLLVGKLIRR